MCRFCEEQCWRDGGWGECYYTDAEFNRLQNEEAEELEGLGGSGDDVWCGHECHVHPTYGFVPEADCPIHDKPRSTLIQRDAGGENG